MRLVSDAEGVKLVGRARRAIERSLEGPPESREPEDRNLAVSADGVFVTVTIDGLLRGCIGYVSPGLDVDSAVARAAVGAATGDSRFEPVRRDELPRLSLHVSLLGPAEPVSSPDAIEVGRDGVVVELGGRRGLLLPRVAEERGWSSERLVAEACRKAGLAEDAWRLEGAILSRFEAQELSEC